LSVSNIGYLTLDNGHTIHSQGLSVGTFGEFYQQGDGTVTVDGPGGIDLAATALVNVSSGNMVINGTSAPTDAATAQIYVDGPSSSLVVNGSIAGDINVGLDNPGGRLAGSGSTGRILVNSGLFQPGNPLSGNGIGVLHTTELTLNSSAVFELQLGGLTPGTGYDQVDVHGAVNLDGEIHLVLANGFTPSYGDLFTVILNDDIDAVSYFGSGFANAQMNSNFSDNYPTVFDTAGNPYLLSFTGENGAFDVSGGNDVVLMAVIPEPSSSAALAAGAALLLGLPRLRHRRSVVQTAIN
jgi:hypothetical protein